MIETWCVLHHGQSRCPLKQWIGVHGKILTIKTCRFLPSVNFPIIQFYDSIFGGFHWHDIIPKFPFHPEISMFEAQFSHHPILCLKQNLQVFTGFYHQI